MGRSHLFLTCLINSLVFLSGRQDVPRRCRKSALRRHKDSGSSTTTCLPISDLVLPPAVLPSHSFLRPLEHTMLFRTVGSLKRRSSGTDNGPVEELRQGHRCIKGGQDSINDFEDSSNACG